MIVGYVCLAIALLLVVTRYGAWLSSLEARVAALEVEAVE